MNTKEQIIKMRKSGYLLKEIADVFNMSYQNVQRILKNPNLKNRKITWTDEMLSMLGNFPDEVIGKRFCISQTAVSKKRWELNIPHQHEADQKERRIKIKEYIVQGLTQAEIGRRLKISRQRVHQIIKTL